MQIISKKTHIDFLSQGRRKAAVALSVLFVVVSLGSLATRGLDFGIDFTGGILLEVGYEQPADLEAIRGTLADAGFADAQVQLFGRETDVLVRLPPQPEDSAMQVRDQLQATLEAGGQNIDLRRMETVSGARLRWWSHCC